MKAVRDITDRYQAQQKAVKPKPRAVSGSDKGGKIKKVGSGRKAAAGANYLSSRNLMILKCCMPFREKSGKSPEITYFG